MKRQLTIWFAGLLLFGLVTGSALVLVALQRHVLHQVAGPGEVAVPGGRKLSMVGWLVQIQRDGPAPMLQLQTDDGTVWTFRLPSDVTLAWMNGQPVLIDGVTPGLHAKILYTGHRRDRTVRRIELIAGRRRPPSAQGAGPGSGGSAGASAGSVPSAPGWSSDGAPQHARRGVYGEGSEEVPDSPEMPTVPALPDTPDLTSIDSRRTR